MFGGLLPERLAEQVLYLPMVLLIWCSLRFGLVEVTAGTILFSTAAILGAWAGVGVYGSNASHETLFDLQTLLFTYAMTSLVVSSIVCRSKGGPVLLPEITGRTPTTNGGTPASRGLVSAIADRITGCLGRV